MQLPITDQSRYAITYKSATDEEVHKLATTLFKSTFNFDVVEESVYSYYTCLRHYYTVYIDRGELSVGYEQNPAIPTYKLSNLINKIKLGI